MKEILKNNYEKKNNRMIETLIGEKYEYDWILIIHLLPPKKFC